MNNQKFNYNKAYILSSIQIVAIAVVISLAIFLTLNHWVNFFINKQVENQQQHLTHMVDLAQNTISPILSDIRNGHLSKSEGLEFIRDTVREMRFNDYYGPNYIFMSNYDGKMLVQPFQPEMEGTNQWNLQDANGIYIIRSLVETAQNGEGGGYVTYEYYPPDSQESQEKLSYVVGLPEVNAYIGTGVYLDHFYSELETIFRWSRFFLIGFVIVMSGASILSMRRMQKTHKYLIFELDQKEKVQESLALSESNLRTVFNGIYDALIIHDLDGKILEVNSRAMAMFKLTREELMNYSIREFSAPDNDQSIRLDELWQIVREKEEVTTEWKTVHPITKETFFLEIALRSITWYGNEVILSVCRDISRRKENERELQRSRQMLEHAQELANIGHYSFEITSRKLTWSKGLYQIFQIPVDSQPPSIEEIDSMLVAGEWHRYQSFFKSTIRSKEKASTEILAYRADGSVRNLHCVLDWVRDSNGKPIMHIGIIQDVTEIKNSQKMLLQEIQKFDALRQIDKKIINRAAVQETMDLIIRQAVLMLDAEYGSIVCMGENGFSPHEINFYDLSGGTNEQMFSNSSMQLQELVVRTKEYQEIEFDNEYLYLGYPIISAGNIHGIIQIICRKAQCRNESARNFLESLASQAAIAIDTIKMFKDLKKTNEELSRAYEATISGWSKALELRDQETQGHSDRVTILSCELAKRFGYSNEDMEHFRRGVLLHDIGKMGVPDEILHKNGPLTDDEWVVMREHPRMARDLLVGIDFLSPAIDIPYCHHERWDGSGYPEGLRGLEIPLSARIFTVVDIWDALISDRPYRKAWSIERTREYLLENAGVLLDPEIVDEFLKMLDEKPMLLKEVMEIRETE